MDEIFATLLNSTLGKAVEKITEVVLNKSWSKDLNDGKIIIEQLNEEYVNKSYLRKHVLPVLKMRTLHNSDYDVLLEDIYYPLSARVASNKDSLTFNDGFTLHFNGVVNIIGIAGQGKSTILRKLFSEELKKAERIPFFIELRRVDDADILSYLFNILNSFGVNCSLDDLKILLQSKRIVLMLDGFDEVRHEHRIQMMNSIKTLHYNFNTPIITSTRPNTEICHETDVHNLYIEDLDLIDKISILLTLRFSDKFSSDDTSFKVLADLLCRNEELEETVCNPILVTLLYYCYPYMNDIPNNIVEFYRSLFDTLYARHDKIKTYTRQRKSSIIGEKAKLCFAAICYNSLLDEKFELRGEELLRYAEDAIETEGYEKECAADFVSDIIDITCLIQPEGNNRFVFLHKSVQEFYAAFAVSNLPMEYKQDIYPNLFELIKGSERLDNFMIFLHSLDSKTYSDEITLKGFRDLGFVDVANMSLEKAVNVFDASLRGRYFKGRSTSNENIITIYTDSELGEILYINILPIMSGSPRFLMTEIDLEFHDSFPSSISKDELTNFKYEISKAKRTQVVEDEEEVLETYKFSLVDFLKSIGIYDDLVKTYHITIQEFYMKTYLPVHEVSIRRISALTRNFKIMKR